ncbi:MAG TPA: SH3 domain-containing protein, partial [Spirochaetes bacterium]|nr:SH3 domain-containing protein [Spirochaetota bacterium]
MKWILIISMLGVMNLMSFCSNPDTSLQVRLNKVIESANHFRDNINFKIVHLDRQKRYAALRIECNFDQIDSEAYLSQLTKVENTLMEEGIYDLKYNIVNNRPGASNNDMDNDNLTLHDGKDEDNISYDKVRTDNTLNEDYSVKESEEQKNKMDSGAGSAIIIKSKKLMASKRGAINYNFVRLRKKPSRKSPIITYVFNGTIVNITGKSKRPSFISKVKAYWYKIETKDSINGWVFGEYLSVTGQKSLSTSFQKNKIYRDFLQKKNLLVQKEYLNVLKSPSNIKISANRLILHVNSDQFLDIPFTLSNKKVQWRVNQIKLKYSKAPKRKGLSNRNSRRVFIDEDYSNKQFRYYDPSYSTSEYDYPDSPKRSQRPSQTIKVSPYQPDDQSTPYTTQRTREDFPVIVPQIARQSLPKVKDYILRLKINDYLSQQLSDADLRRAEAIQKIIGIKLYRHDYKKDIKFHSAFNIFHDTLILSLDNIDFDRKRATFSVRRVHRDPDTGP